MCSPVFLFVLHMSFRTWRGLDRCLRVYSWHCVDRICDTAHRLSHHARLRSFGVGNELLASWAAACTRLNFCEVTDVVVPRISDTHGNVLPRNKRSSFSRRHLVLKYFVFDKRFRFYRPIRWFCSRFHGSRNQRALWHINKSWIWLYLSQSTWTTWTLLKSICRPVMLEL